MISELPPWSYSMLESFEQCPKKAFHRYILKEKEPPTPEIEEGNRVHKALEDRLNPGRTALPAQYAKYEPIVIAIEKQPGTRYCESKFGLTKSLTPCSFFDKEVWGRGAADITLINGASAWIGDYKTGKKREKELQLQILAMFAFKAHPEVQQITGCNIWLKTNEIGTPFTFTREKEAVYWAAILPRLQAMEKALATNIWPERPSGLCGWCAVTSCRFNKR